jgi:hypothetical protein
MSKGVEAVKTVEQPPSVSFNFTEKFKAPSNFKDLNIAEGVKVIIHGKVKSIEQGKNYDGKNYQNFSVEMDRVEISTGGPKSIAEAKTIARERVKDFK